MKHQPYESKPPNSPPSLTAAGPAQCGRVERGGVRGAGALPHGGLPAPPSGLQRRHAEPPDLPQLPPHPHRRPAAGFEGAAFVAFSVWSGLCFSNIKRGTSLAELIILLSIEAFGDELVWSFSTFSIFASVNWHHCFSFSFVTNASDAPSILQASLPLPSRSWGPTRTGSPSTSSRSPSRWR